MLLGHRLYDASVGRFLSADPAKDGSNWYDYCQNNPTAGVDPEGLRIVYKGLSFGQQREIERLLDRIASSGAKVGPNGEDVSKTIGEMRDPGTVYTIINDNDRNNPRGPGIPGGGYGPDHHDTYFDPNQRIKIPVKDGAGNTIWVSALPIRILGHELGHTVGGYGGSNDEEIKTINEYENPISDKVGDSRPRVNHDSAEGAETPMG